MIPAPTWRTDDSCPICGAGLNATSTTGSQVRQDCPLCGWSTTWDTSSGKDDDERTGVPG